MQETAVSDFTHAIRLEPTNATLYVNRASAYDSVKNYEQSLRDLDEAIRLQPEVADHYNRRGSVEFERENFTAAIHDFDQAIRRDPNNAERYAYRDRSKQRVDQLDAAVQDYIAALNRTNDTASLSQWLLELGNLHRRREDESEVQTVYNLLAKTDREFADREVPVFHKRRLRVANRTGHPIKAHIKFHLQTEDGRWKWDPEDADTWRNYSFNTGEIASPTIANQYVESDSLRIYAESDDGKYEWVVGKEKEVNMGIPDEGYRSPEILVFEYVFGSVNP